ncbi:MAG TPA: hypothetical protein VFD42_02740, partial [Chloroflexota bacterium]|nr:hypothetical protein [Chloroflexota bacterium]
SGHYQSDATACPGTALKKLLPALRSNAASRLSGGTAPTLTETSSAQRDPAPASLSFQWSSPAGGPYLYCLEGWSKEDGQDDITYLSGHEPAGYGDELAKRQAWVETSGTSAAFSGLKPGHYTMHLRTLSGSRADRYEANLTFQVKEGTPVVGVAVSSISPNETQAGSAADVTIRGNGFVAGAGVEFLNGDGMAPVASKVVVSSDGTITARVSTQTSKRPPKDRVWDVRVTNLDGGSGVLPNGFTVTL